MTFLAHLAPPVLEHLNRIKDLKMLGCHENHIIVYLQQDLLLVCPMREHCSRIL